MSVNSLVFVTVFLPFLFLADRLCGKCLWLSNALLLAASLLFYAWGDPSQLVLVVASALANWGLGLSLEAAKNTTARKALLACVLTLNLGVLFFYKYLNFFFGIVNSLAGRQVLAQQSRPLPLGLSFFTFSAMAYGIDIYRRRFLAEKNPFYFTLYIAFFAKISVGPISRWQDFGPQIRRRHKTAEKAARGLRRFCYGMGKKVLIANVLGEAVDQIYGLPMQEVTGLMAWLAAIGYALQIYYDFSGFADMAVGLGQMFGFDLCENFNYPYCAGSIREFWRKWHISLSSWFMEYVYIPLGGSRKGNLRTYGNLLIVFLCTGLWHGASWGYLAWGLWHAAFLILERAWLGKLLDRSRVLKHVYTALVLLPGWVIFRVVDLRQAASYLKRMALPWLYTRSPVALQELVSVRCVLAGAAGILGMGFLQRALARCPAVQRMKYGVAELCWCMLLLATGILLMVSGTYQPAIYLNF